MTSSSHHITTAAVKHVSLLWFSKSRPSFISCSVNQTIIKITVTEFQITAFLMNCDKQHHTEVRNDPSSNVSRLFSLLTQREISRKYSTDPPERRKCRHQHSAPTTHHATHFDFNNMPPPASSGTIYHVLYINYTVETDSGAHSKLNSEGITERQRQNVRL